MFIIHHISWVIRMGVADIEEIKKYIKKLKQRKKKLEREYEELTNLWRRGEISEKEYQERKRKLEREYVEIMDRLAQMRYFTGEEALFA